MWNTEIFFRFFCLLRFKRLDLICRIEELIKRQRLKMRREAESGNILREQCGDGPRAALERFSCSSGKKRSLGEGKRQGHLL